jgi:acetyl esterase
MPEDVARKINDREAAIMFGPVERVFDVEERDIAGAGGDFRVRIYRPDGGVRLPVLVYFHGGGWVVGGLDSHDGVTRHLCAHGRCMVVAVDYRLAPEHRFPAALEDAWAATVFVHEHLAELGGDPARLAVGGDSAGGTLAAVVAMRARDARVPLKLQLLVYPVLDCSGIAAGTGDDAYGWWVQRYLREASDGLSPDASPLLAADLRGLAPALILSCQEDILRHEAAAYERRLRDAGVAVDHVEYSGLIHGAYRMPAVLDDAREMLDDSAAALVRALAAT